MIKLRYYYEVKEMSRKAPFLLKAVYILSFFLAFYFLLPSTVREKLEVKVVKSDKTVYNAIPYHVIDDTAIDTFIGTLTGYGPDCIGCNGNTGCDPSQDVTNGNIYYEDAYYGKLRIVASDPKYPCGSIVKITAPNLYKEPILAIILDRGGVIIQSDKHLGHL
jgi:hypothetical protein